MTQGNWKPPSPNSDSDGLMAIFMEVTRIAADLRELLRDVKDCDHRIQAQGSRADRLEYKIDRLSDEVNGLRKPRGFHIPWSDILRGLTPWLPGIMVIILTLLGHKEMAKVLAALGSAH